MKDIKQEVNVSKVFKFTQDTLKQVKTFTRMEQEVFFNQMRKANIISDPELCDAIFGVAFKKRQPQLKGMMGALKDKLKTNIDILRGHEDDQQ